MRLLQKNNIAVLFLCCAICFLGSAGGAMCEEAQIVFAGVMFGETAGNIEQMNARFPYLHSDWNAGQKNAFGKRLRDIVNRKKQSAGLGFKLIDVSGIDKKKEFEEVESPLSLTFLITREHLYKDEYQLTLKGQEKTLTKYYFDVGISAIFFSPSGNQDKIEYSVPVIAEDILMGPFSREQIRKQFFNTYARAVKSLFKRLSKVIVRNVKAKVIKVSGKTAKIDKGKRDGVLSGMTIYIQLPSGTAGWIMNNGTAGWWMVKNNNTFVECRITQVKNNNAFVECKKGELKKGDQVSLYICKSNEDQTFQVTDVSITSKIGKKIFSKDEKFGILCAQFFSDYLADRSGAVVLPPRMGAAYTSGAKKSLISAYDLEGNHYEFAIPEAKNPVALCITGLKKGKLKGNDVNQIWGYKVWIEKDIGGNKTKVSEAIREEVIVGVKEVNDCDVFREVVLQTLAKLAKE